jgi:DNA-binding XRE family transcriptional regulator
MTAELGDWLTELGGSEPSAAAEVGATLVAVLESAEPSGLVIVGEPGRSTQPVTDDPRETADLAYERRLAEFQLLRRRVADAASKRRAAEVALSAQQDAAADAAVIAALAERLAAAQLHEANLTRVSESIQADIDGFRTAIQTAKARFTAAEASLRVAEAIEAASGEPDPDLDQRREDLRAAEERLRELRYPATWHAVIRRPSGEAGTESAAERPKPPPERPRAAAPVPGLLELRADPLGSDIRILFALEPTDTVTLLAVLEGPDAVSEHGAHATTLAGDLLTEIRDDGWPADISQVLLADADAFLARFFPADDGNIARRAAGLAKMTSPSGLRAELHLTIDEVAARSGLTASRVAAIERDGLRTARVHEAIALARALGARLELPAGSGPVTG